jgi:hypothetical protein
MNSVFTFSHLFYRHLNLIHIFGGTDYWSQPLNMNSVFIFSHLLYCHLNFNSYFGGTDHWSHPRNMSNVLYILFIILVFIL